MNQNVTTADDDARIDLKSEEHFTADGPQSTVSQAWEGAFLYASWGYNQTNVDFVQIIDVSDSGKTVKAKRCTGTVQSSGKGSESVAPEGETYGDEFRLHVREFNGSPVFRGSYPFIKGDMDEGTRSGSFYPYAKGDQGVHRTAPGYGH